MLLICLLGHAPCKCSLRQSLPLCFVNQWGNQCVTYLSSFAYTLCISSFTSLSTSIAPYLRDSDYGQVVDPR